MVINLILLISDKINRNFLIASILLAELDKITFLNLIHLLIILITT